MQLSNAIAVGSDPMPFTGDNEPNFKSDPVGLGYRYWKSKVIDGRLPGRGDIDPAEMIRFLPNTVLLDVVPEPLDFRYRVIGTEVVSYMNRDLTGNWLSKIGHLCAPSQVWSNFKIVAGDQTPLYVHTPYLGAEVRFWMIEDVILPLVGADGKTNMLLNFMGILPRP